MRGLGLSAIVLIAVNVVPVVGVVAFGWKVIDILWLYWAENVVIGILNIPRILTARGPSIDSHQRTGLVGAIFIAAFFAVHYGGFTLGHGVFIANVFAGDASAATLGEEVAFLARAIDEPAMRVALAGLFASHALSLAVNWFGRGERHKHDARAQMFAVYGRIVILHIVILLGGFGAQAIGEPVFALVLLVALKTGVDLVAHVRSHDRLAERGAAPGVFS